MIRHLQPLHLPSERSRSKEKVKQGEGQTWRRSNKKKVKVGEGQNKEKVKQGEGQSRRWSKQEKGKNKKKVKNNEVTLFHGQRRKGSYKDMETRPRLNKYNFQGRTGTAQTVNLAALMQRTDPILVCSKCTLLMYQRSACAVDTE